MELAVRLTVGTTDAAGGTPTGALVVVAVCSALLLAVGVAHYRGAWRHFALTPLLSSTSTAACAWIGAGGLLVAGALALGDATSTAAQVVAVLLGAVGLAVAVVGLVGLAWLPRPLRPRWLREHQAQHASGRDLA